MPVKVTLVNDTPKQIGRAWEYCLEYMCEGGDGKCMTNGPRIDAGATATLEFPTESFGKKVLPDQCSIKVMKSGYLLQPGDVAEIVVHDGAEYRFRVDNDNAPIDLATGTAIVPLFVAALECNWSVPPGETGASVWAWIAAKVGRNPENTEGLAKSFEDFMCSRTFAKPCWFKTFLANARRPQVVAATDGTQRAAAALSSGDFLLTVYHRALERMPGGNADMFVLKHTYDPTSRDVHRVRGQCYKNWDGWDVGVSDAVTDDYAVNATKAFDGYLLPALRAYVEAGGDNDALATVNEERSDSDEYETQWSSIEVLLFDRSAASTNPGLCQLPATTPEAHALLLRVHQVARYTMDSAYDNKDVVPDAPAPIDGPLAAVVGAASASTGVGMPNAYSEGHTPASGGFAPQRKAPCPNSCYVMPFYLLSME